jgi:hypothetical protein
MPRIENFKVAIRTGNVGTQEQPQFSFNGFVCQFEEPTGGTGAGERFEGCFAPRSVPHELFLSGPEEGRWEVSSIDIHYELSRGETYDIHLGPVTLDETNAVNLWRERPQPCFDV